MDLRKTLISVLWILLLNLDEDCHAEEGMWKKKRVSVCGCFLGLIGPKPASAAERSTDRCPFRGQFGICTCPEWRQVHSVQ